MPEDFARSPAPGSYPSLQWWKAFGDPALDWVVDSVLESNLDMAVAVARVEQARERARIAKAAVLPVVQGRAGINDLSTPTNAGFGAQIQELGLGDLAPGFSLPERLGITTYSLGADFLRDGLLGPRPQRRARGRRGRNSCLRSRNRAAPRRNRHRRGGQRQGGLGSAGVALAEAELNLSRTEVKAPFSGVVRTESVDVGQLVAAGQGVGRLYASDAVEVVVPLSDTGAALLPSLWDLRAGDDSRRIAARVTAEYGASTYSWDGYVDRAEASLDEQTRTIDVIVRVPRPFAAGAPAEANPGGEEAEAAVALRPGKPRCGRSRDGKVTIVTVRVLQRSDDTVFVIGDLEADQAVVTGGITFATEGMVVAD